jgi:hypothetical protein
MVLAAGGAGVRALSLVRVASLKGVAMVCVAGGVEHRGSDLDKR